jgi:hypothetical protein
VSIEGGFSNVLNQKIEQQFKDGKLEADMVLFRPRRTSCAGSSRGKMLAFKPGGLRRHRHVVQGSRRAPSSSGMSGLLSYAYNTQQLKPETAPKSALDFLKPEFRGKMIACYPA